MSKFAFQRTRQPEAIENSMAHIDVLVCPMAVGGRGAVVEPWYCGSDVTCHEYK